MGCYRIPGDGLAALKLLRNDGFGLVVLDIGLPVMDGWELLSRMRGDRELHDTPVIIISARPVASAIGQAPVFRKPLAIDQLLDAIRRNFTTVH